DHQRTPRSVIGDRPWAPIDIPHLRRNHPLNEISQLRTVVDPLGYRGLWSATRWPPSPGRELLRKESRFGTRNGLDFPLDADEPRPHAQAQLLDERALVTALVTRQSKPDLGQRNHLPRIFPFASRPRLVA